MNETAIPNSSAIADAMLKRTGEILRAQAEPAPATETFVEKVIGTLKSLGAPSMMISGQRSLDAINALLQLAEAEQTQSVATQISAARITDLWDGMPGGGAAFGKEWGYYQFARAVEGEVRASILVELCRARRVEGSLND